MADRMRPDFSFEIAAYERGLTRVAGVDEVGRGPLAGPVMAAAVRLDPAHIPDGLADSKMLTPARRERLFQHIMGTADVGVGQASVQEIDRVNILQASFLAMRRAVAALREPPDHLIIDGRLLPRDLPCGAEGVVKGDARCLSVAAASIVAKVLRDRLMVDLAQQYPGYGWESNAGYPTKLHLSGLQNLGVTPWHRRSFGPVHKILYQDISITT